MTVYDIAGLTRGSSTGAGLGNAFLSHIRAVDAIFQVVRSFDDAEIIHIEGDVNPTRDLDIISEELRLKDIEFVEKALENQKKKTRMGGQSLELKKARQEQDTIEKILAWLNDGKDIRKGVWGPKEVSKHFFFYHVAHLLHPTLALHDDKRPIGLNLNPARRLPHIYNARGIVRKKTHSDSILLSHLYLDHRFVVHPLTLLFQIEVINPLMLLTAKPVVYLVNLSEKDFIRKKNKHLPKIAEWVNEHAKGDPIIPISVSYESRLTQFETEAEAKEEMKTVGADSVLPKVITQMRKTLQLGSFFTVGPDEVRQWTIRTGTKAPQAAGVIHTDFEKTFIQALVFAYKTLHEMGDEAEVKAKGKVMTKGKEYVVEDGDILHIKAGAAKS